MKVLLYLILLSIHLIASEIVSHRVYEKDGRVDIMLTFDSEYEGKISQKKDKNSIILILSDATIGSNLTKSIRSPFIQKMQLVPITNGTLIKLEGDEKFIVQASKTVDNFGLRLRITPTLIQNDSLDEKLIVNEDEDFKIQTKKEENIANAYLKVLFVLALMVAFLYLLKRWLENRGGTLSKNGSSWLFDKKEKIDSTSKIKILNQKALDHKNRVVLISFEDKRYLLLLGETNLLLDDFQGDSKSNQQSAFNQILDQNEAILEEFIQNNKLNNYKNMASKDILS
ncbi:MAG: hypothetical protein DSZ06_01090 [Sulfurospirillum sp.]|nr:MAG: hypothetical protein DSZ06_01090 [Sulfurospirillum sp.]